MINDVKLGLKLTKYAYAMKSSIIGMGIMIPVGILMCTAGIVVKGQFPGGYFFCLILMFFIQLNQSMFASNMVLSSPHKKSLMTTVNSVLAGCGALITFAISILVEAVLGFIMPDSLKYLSGQILITAVMAALFLLYLAICYKYFLIGTVIFIGTFVWVYLGNMLKKDSWGVNFGDGTWSGFLLAVFLGLVIIAAGIVFHFVVTKALYKVPVSKYSQTANIRKLM